MTFQHLGRLYLAIPLLFLLLWLQHRRRHYWAHSGVDSLREELGGVHLFLRLPRLLELLAVACLLLALLGPIYPSSLKKIERVGYQFVLVMDLSLSMERENLEGNRLPPAAFAQVPRAARGPSSIVAPPGSKMEAVKQSALKFVKARGEDAFGLVVFSNNGYLVTPATYDHEALRQYLLTIGAHSISNEGFTAIGEGLGTANDYFAYTRAKSAGPPKGRVIILLTDGDSNFGRDPIEQLRRARADGTRVYYFGVALARGLSQFLSRAVRATGGNYFDVRQSAHLEEAFEHIDKMEKGFFYSLAHQVNEPAHFLFVLLAAASLALRLMMHAIPHFLELN